jgi:Ca-activated chloride channel family protein
VASSGRDLLVAVDVSGSMDYPDMVWQNDEVSRLTLVKQLLGDFLEHRQGDRVGLILFGSQAYLQAPLTFDRKTVRVWLDEARIGIAGKNTAIGDAIGLALKRLRLRPAQSRVLILVTDGANNAGQIDPATAARLAAGEGVKIYPIGIGADPDKGATTILGLNPSLDLDEPALREIAEISGGQYFRARDGAELERIGKALDTLEPVTQQPTQARPALALYHWPLSFALLLSILLVVHERWPHNPLYRFLARQPVLHQGPQWRQRFNRLRRRR